MITALVTASLACSGRADTARVADSAQKQRAPSDTINAPASFAVDATLTLQVAEPFHEVLRAVADSFAAREAVRIEFAPLADSIVTVRPAISSLADVVVVSALTATRFADDSTFWALPFAESLPAPVTDSAAVDTVSVKKRPPSTRRLSRRRADSIKADSLRRAALLRDSLLAVRARSDSAHTMVLTIPTNAPNGSVAERFVRYLLTGGRNTLVRSGARLIVPLVIRGNGIPLGIRSVVDTVLAPDSSAVVDSIARR